MPTLGSNLRDRPTISKHHLIVPVASLESHDQHEPVTDSNDDYVSHDTGRYASRQEVPDLQVSLSCLGIFHHDSSY